MPVADDLQAVVFGDLARGVDQLCKCRARYDGVSLLVRAAPLDSFCNSLSNLPQPALVGGIDGHERLSPEHSCEVLDDGGTTLEEAIDAGPIELEKEKSSQSLERLRYRLQSGDFLEGTLLDDLASGRVVAAEEDLADRLRGDLEIGKRSVAAVTTARVPSEPIRSCVRS
jgi:hypothetical protein